MIELTLPWPPSVNNYWKKWRNRMVISEGGRLYREAVALQVSMQAPNTSLECPLVVEIEAWRPDRRKRDLDNLCKATLDALATAGVYRDDSQIQDLRIYWAEHLGGMLKVKIKERKRGEERVDEGV